MKRLNQAIGVCLKPLLTVMVVIMAMVILAQVIWRYLLQEPLVWSEELALLLMCWITFLGSALILQTKEHLAIDFFVLSLPPPLQIGARILATALVLSFSLVLIWGSWAMLERTYASIMPGLQISVAWQYGGAFVGGILISLAAFEQFIEALRGILRRVGASQ